MHYLDPVAISDDGRGPFIATHYVLIVLDRNSLRRQRQLGDQVTECEPVSDLLCFTVDFNPQCLFPSLRQDDPPQLCNLSIRVRANQERRATGFECRQREQN
jgi:hypothetical protein